MDPEIDSIASSLQTLAAAMSLRVRPHPELARRDNDWIFLPVRIEGPMGAFERAERLQNLEEAWEERNPGSQSHLSLIPASG